MRINYLFIIVSSILLYACNSSKSKPDGAEKVYTVDELTEVLYDKVGDTLSVTGFCADMCPRGHWVVLQGQDTTKAIQAIAGKNVTAFNPEMKYSNMTVKAVLDEKRVDSLFLVDWETRLDESLKRPDGGNPEAVALFKEQIAQIYEAMKENREKYGRNYWSQFTLRVSAYEVDE